jgi:branched-chain amino acid transport system ATP-binding protein
VSAILAVEDLRKTFGGIVAVDGATFTVEEGSVTGLIGPNGAGKTTIFNLISGFYERDGGEIRYDGTDIDDLMTVGPVEQGIWSTSAGIGFGGLGAGVAGGVGYGSPGVLASTAAAAGVGIDAYH